MCDGCDSTSAIWSRRRLIGAGLAFSAGAALVAPGTAAEVGRTTPSRTAVAVAPGLNIRPRSDWGPDLAPLGPVSPEDVRFLLVHHTASPNRVSDPGRLIRSVYSYHTSPAKGWVDVAYNFFVAPDGSVWEGRAGSLDGPVVADATGGSQGFAQLICLIGDHRTVPPTAPAQEAMIRLVSWLRWRYRLARGETATATFVSRGSQLHPAGTTVTTPVISGHRDHSATACPGDAAYALLPRWRREVESRPDPEFADSGPYRRADRLGVTDFGAT